MFFSKVIYFVTAGLCTTAPTNTVPINQSLFSCLQPHNLTHSTCIYGPLYITKIFLSFFSDRNQKTHPHILNAIGNTPLVKLSKIPKEEGIKCDMCKFIWIF